MKSKGINPLEKHAEKIFVALIALVFVGVLIMQFLGGATEVKVGQRDGVPVERAYNEVVSMAQSKLQQLRSERVAEQVPPPPGDVVAEFRRRLEPTRDTVAALPIPLTRPTPVEGVGEPIPVAQGQQARYAPPTIPTPRQVTGWAFGGTIDPVVVATTAPLQEHVPITQPHDKFSVSVAAHFDAQAMRDMLQRDPDGDGPLTALRQPWWANRMEMLDVELWRREVLAPGEFGEPELLPPPPGRFSLRDVLADDLEPSAVGSLIEQARQRAGEIRQPAYYHMIAGPMWRPPAGAEDQRVRQARDLIAELEDLRRQRAELADRLAQVERQAAAPGGARPAFAAMQQRQPGRGDGGRNPDQADRERRQRRIEQITADIRRLDDRLEQVESQLEDLGADPEADDPLAGLLVRRGPVLPLSDLDETVIWSHDVTAEPGATYQYQLRVRLPNPLFGRFSQVVEEQRDLTTSATLVSEPTAWCDPITIGEQRAMFIVGARPAQTGAVGAQVPTATAEIYRFFYGYWRMQEVRLEPGDAAAAAIDVTRFDAPIFDVQLQAGGGAMVEGIEPASEPVTVDTGWYLLDVVPAVALNGAAAGRDRTWLAAMASPDELIEMRNPDQELRAPRRASLQASVEEGAAGRVRPPRGVSADQLPGADDEDGPASPAPGRDGRQAPGIGGG